MRKNKFSLAVCCAVAIALPGQALSQRAQQNLPVPTWEVTGDEDDLYGDYGCLRWPEVQFPMTPNEDPEYIDQDEDQVEDRDDDDRPSVRVDDNDRPIVDRAGNFIRCEAPPIAGWLNGTTMGIIGALIVGQIAIFAGGGGASAGNNNNDSPG